MRGTLIALGLAVGCAHAQSVVVAKCEDKTVALRVARDFAAQTEQSDGVKLRLDETRLSDRPDQWHVRTQVGKGGFGQEADLVVRKSDCAADWKEIRYEM